MCKDLVEVDPRHNKELEQAFSHFWNSIVGIAGTPARPISKETIDVTKVDDHHLTVCTPKQTQALWLRGLPYRPGDSSQTIDAWLQFEETVRAVDGDDGVLYEIEESVTRLQYVKQKHNDEGERIGSAEHGLHFDFAELPESNHPVFHAQFDPSCIISSAMEGYRIDFPKDPTPAFPRVPSAPIDVAGVTYMLLHDHDPEILDEDNGWPSETHTALRKLPQFPSACFEPDPQDGTGMVCDWWYLHATANKNGVPQRDFLTR